MERAYGITKDIYNKKCVSKNAKIRHYSTVVKPECLYASAVSYTHLVRKSDI